MDSIQILLQPIWSFYVILRAILVVLDIGFIFLFIFAAVELFSYRPRFIDDPVAAAEHRRRRAKATGPTPRGAWKAIRAKAEEGTHEAMRIAIIEADGFVDNVLKKQGYAGETFADRLTQFDPRRTVNLDRVWGAHRVRNDIVHTPGFELAADTVQIALDNYEAFLYEIGGL